MSEVETKSVRIEYDGGQWIVFVYEAGVVTSSTFADEKSASDFAVAERNRLGWPDPKATDLA